MLAISFANIIGDLQSAFSAAERVFRIIDEDPEPEDAEETEEVEETEDVLSELKLEDASKTAETAEKKMGKRVQKKLNGLHNDIAVFVFNKADKHHYGAADERNYISKENVHLLSPAFLSFLMDQTL